jgi:magnesium transporter
MITVHLHTLAPGRQTDLRPEQIAETLANGCELLWVDVVNPSAADVRLLGEEFGFHPLALEDAAKRHQRPKVDAYDGFLFLVFYGLRAEDDAPGGPHADRIRTVEIALFVGPNYLVTVHAAPLAEIQETATRWRENIGTLGGRGVGVLVYSLLDAIVDNYFPVVDAISDRIDEVEDAIFERDHADSLQDILAMRRDLLAVRRVLGPERDVMNILVRRDLPYFDDATVVYLQDVYDHILRVTDGIDGARELLAGALDAQLSMTSNRLNQTVRTLTSASIALMGMTLVAGVYGMNFAHMPELGWRYGYPFALGLMLAIGAAVLLLFRRIRWL